jgi:C4-dicarboxylate-specific signal transduction histidine kinase
MSSVDDRPRELLIRTERDEGDRIRPSVKDAGVGFYPQAVDRLFEAFYTTKKIIGQLLDYRELSWPSGGDTK